MTPKKSVSFCRYDLDDLSIISHQRIGAVVFGNHDQPRPARELAQRNSSGGSWTTSITGTNLASDLYGPRVPRRTPRLYEEQSVIECAVVYQRGGEFDSTVCSGSVQLKVLVQSTRCYCQRGAVQHHYDRLREPRGTLLVSAQALRVAPISPLGH